MKSGKFSKPKVKGSRPPVKKVLRFQTVTVGMRVRFEEESINFVNLEGDVVEIPLNKLSSISKLPPSISPEDKPTLYLIVHDMESDSKDFGRVESTEVFSALDGNLHKVKYQASSKRSDVAAVLLNKAGMVYVPENRRQKGSIRILAKTKKSREESDD